jgi:hypothetical protein
VPSTAKARCSSVTTRHGRVAKVSGSISQGADCYSPQRRV